jgi:probable DNA metabolism protein
LTAVFDSYYTHKNAVSITSDKNSLTLIDTAVPCAEDLAKAGRVRAGIIKAGGQSAYGDVDTAYRSGEPLKERVIFDFLKLLFKHGRKAYEMHGETAALDFTNLVRRVTHEVHRLTGFVRLQETASGIYYGYYGSDNDVLELLTPHMCRRFNTSKFVIHDYKRRKIAFFDGAECRYAIAPKTLEIELSHTEELFRKIWKEYCGNISIDTRVNTKLQDGFLPKRYRYFMNEF